MAKGIIPSFNSGCLEGICRVIADTDTGLKGTEIGQFLAEVGIADVDSSNTKWKRLYNAFANYQNNMQRSNNILAFISRSMQPVRFVGKQDQFEDLVSELNKRLSFVGWEYRSDGKFARIDATTTISEAEKRASRLKSKLEIRNAHPKIYEYCRAELLVDNYFHTVFEAAKSVAEVIRDRTGLTEDGASLVDKAFIQSAPLITINSLQSETEISEHKGFANLLRGVFGMFRNTLAHSPRLTWEISEEDALDMLSTISLIHRRLEVQSVQ